MGNKLMNERATFELVQWAESLKGPDLMKLPESVRYAVRVEQARMEEYMREAKRDYDIIQRFPENSIFKDDQGRECKVWKHRIDRDGCGIDAQIEGVGMGYFHSSQLSEIKV